MPRENYSDIIAFIAVARESSFTRAAAKLGVSQSALSHTIRALETRLGVRLLMRTTRSVSLTEAGKTLFDDVADMFTAIDSSIASLSDWRENPTGTIRITANHHAADTLLWPRLAPLLARYPDIKLEINIDYGLTNIVEQRFDIGVRIGDQIAKDMIAVKIGPDMSMAVVGSPDYFAKHPQPEVPADLIHHQCINLRLQSHGGLYAWEFDNGDNQVNVHVEGQLTFNTTNQMLQGALDGFGLAYVPDDIVKEHIEQGRLVRVLTDWCEPFPGYHIYYPNRRQSSAAFNLVVDTLRYSANV